MTILVVVIVQLIDQLVVVGYLLILGERFAEKVSVCVRFD